jgi:hypothetical protein
VATTGEEGVATAPLALGPLRTLADLVREHLDYVARVTADDGEMGKALLSTFQDLEKRYRSF